MDHRKEGRFKPNQVATLRVLGMIPGPVMQACVLDVSGGGMRLRSQVPVPCGAPVEVEVSNTVSRGSVCRCEVIQNSYQLGVKVLKRSARFC